MRLCRDVLGMTEVLRVDNGAGQFVVMLDAGDGSHVELFEQTPARAAAGPAADGDFGDLLSHLGTRSAPAQDAAAQALVARRAHVRAVLADTLRQAPAGAEPTALTLGSDGWRTHAGHLRTVSQAIEAWADAADHYADTRDR